MPRRCIYVLYEDASLMNLVHTTPTYFSKIHPNIILTSTSWSFYWSLSLWLSHQNPVCIPLLPHALPLSSSMT
jgi:hypothetical protein